MGQSTNELLGKGIYPIHVASHLTEVPARTIRRWVRGYHFDAAEGKHFSPPVWKPQLAPIDGAIALGFLDLIEVRIVSAFLARGVTWTTIRRAARHAQSIFKTDHPFATARFKTDGRGIFTHLPGNAAELVDLKDCQLTFRQVVEPFLKDLEFEGSEGHALRWWPLGQRRRMIVIDPARSFGQPVLAREGVPTLTLARAFEAEQDETVVARWFDVSKDAVRESVRYEKRLAAA